MPGKHERLHLVSNLQHDEQNKTKNIVSTHPKAQKRENRKNAHKYFTHSTLQHRRSNQLSLFSQSHDPWGEDTKARSLAPEAVQRNPWKRTAASLGSGEMDTYEVHTYVCLEPQKTCVKNGHLAFPSTDYLASSMLGTLFVVLQALRLDPPASQPQLPTPPAESNPKPCPICPASALLLLLLADTKTSPSRSRAPLAHFR